MSNENPLQWVRPAVRRLHPYVPGEQPKEKGLVKLNTNENPYPPSPKVLAAISAAVDGRLRLYPDPMAEPLRQALARLHGCAPENILIGNGSDEILALAIRAFAEPSAGPRSDASESLARVQYFSPSYSLYPTLVDIHGASRHPIALLPDYSLPCSDDLQRLGWDTRAALTLVTTPNAPSGRGYATSDLEALCARQQGVIVLDEAYVDFADENALSLALRHPQVLVSRTFSKAYSLCFQRLGYVIGHPDLIEGMARIKDSYNVNGLAQVAGLATLEDLDYYQRNFQRIKATRAQVTHELSQLGFRVLPSQTNFVLAEPPGPPAQEWQRTLRSKGFLVRWFSTPGIQQYVRITIGTESEMEAFLNAVRSCGGRSCGGHHPQG